MKMMYKHLALLTVLLILIEISGTGGRNAFANEPPVAEAGPSRYAAQEPLQLDGTRSHDPDHSGPLSYAWTQISGPPLVIAGAQTATPTISGFVQTGQVQDCQLELLVHDGQQASSPDTVKVVIVPDFGPSTLKLENPPFDPNKPTAIYFWGGDCVNGTPGHPWEPDPGWLSGANVIDFPYGYTPDSGTVPRSYYKYGDMILACLSAVAPDYKQAIQTIGFSTGVDPALDVGLRLNEIYRDARYAVNRVTQIDGACRMEDAASKAGMAEAWKMQLASYRRFLDSAVDGEQCWIDFYYGVNGYRAEPVPPSSVLWVRSGLDHLGINDWYRNSLTGSDMHRFNGGVVAGAYWSVAGPGKNLQLASAPGVYYFLWDGSEQNGAMSLFNQSQCRGRLPGPVALAPWAHVSDGSGAIDGVVLSCHRSENAVSYQLLLGSDAYRVAHYEIISETPAPPAYIMTDLPAQETWWTVRARDQYGSTIYADPVRLDLTGLPLPKVQNARTGLRYGLIYQALLDAEPNDRVLLEPGTYVENVEFGDKPLTLSSLDPNNSEIVAGTIIRGRAGSPAITFSGPESRGCVLAGLTIQSDTAGMSCRDANPTIRKCVVDNPDGIALEFWWGCAPDLIDCTVLGQVKEGGDPGLIGYWKLDESEGVVAHDAAGGNDGMIMGLPQWRPQGGAIGGTLELNGKTLVTSKSALNPAHGPFSVLAWIKEGGLGQTIISQAGGANWLMADAQGALMTELSSTGQASSRLASQAMITDGNWHRIVFTWDGAKRRLFVDSVLAAEDAQESLAASSSNLVIGASKNMALGSFWSGPIDDVRIYNRVVRP